MAVDLMEMVKGAVSKQIMGQIGGMLGTDEAKTSSTFETIAGSILGGMMKKAGTQQGADVIFESAQKQDDGILDKLGDLLGGGEATDEFEKSGGSILENVFGGGNSQIMDVLAKAVGLDGNLVGKLLKMAAPIIMAVIGKYIKGNAMDAPGLGNLLGEQKNYLGNYLPQSLSSDLGLGNMLSNASESVADVGQSASDAANKGGGLLKILLPLIIIAAGGWAIWQFVILPQRTNVSSQNQEVGSTLRAGFSDISSGLTNLKDEAGANELVKNVNDFTGKIDALKIGDLTGLNKTAISSMIKNFLDELKRLMDNISDGPLKTTVQPAIDALIQKLTPFSPSSSMTLEATNTNPGGM